MSEIREYKFLIIFILVIVLIVGGMFGLSLYKDFKIEAEANAIKAEKEKELARYDYLKDDENPVVTITMDNNKKIVLELYPKEAPTSVENFIALIKAGFYDGVAFTRIEKDFVIQCGAKAEATTPEYTIEGEFSANGIENSIAHEKGVISFARNAYNPDSAYSQFFICLDTLTGLDGNYAAFGRVVEGLDVVEELALSETKSEDKDSEDFGIPVKEIIMKTVTVDTKGIEYAEPKKIAVEINS